MTTRAPTDAAIRALATPTIYERGKAYWRSGAVSTLVRRGDDLTAEVEGSDVAPYHVTLRLDGARITETRCTCPYEWEGCCKHVVATLLAVRDNPAAVSERPPLRDILAALDKPALVDLIAARAAEDPGLTTWIEAEIAITAGARPGRPIDRAPVAAQARAVLTGRYGARDYWDGYRAHGPIDELQALVGKAVPFLAAGDGRNALRLLETITDVFVDEWSEVADTDEELYRLFTDLGHLMAEAVLMSDLDEAERDHLDTTLSDWADQLADQGLDEAFAAAALALDQGWDDPALQAVLAGTSKRWLASGLADEAASALTAARLRVLEAAGRTDAYVNLARAAGKHGQAAAMLLTLGRADEAVAHATGAFTRPVEALDFARLLKAAGRDDAAFAIAEAGLLLHGGAADPTPWVPGGSAAPLAQWLRDTAAEAGRDALARHAACAAFGHTLSVADYRAAQAVAGESWAALKGDLLTALMAAVHAADRLEILLDEGLIDEAVNCAGKDPRSSGNDAVLLRLLEAAHASHGDWVIRIAEAKAAAIMESGSAGLYDRAAAWLERAALAYEAAGRIDD